MKFSVEFYSANLKIVVGGPWVLEGIMPIFQRWDLELSILKQIGNRYQISLAKVNCLSWYQYTFHLWLDLLYVCSTCKCWVWSYHMPSLALYDLPGQSLEGPIKCQFLATLVVSLSKVLFVIFYLHFGEIFSTLYFWHFHIHIGGFWIILSRC